MSFEIEEDFFKLMNNSFCGKTINVRLINNAKKLYKPSKNEFLRWKRSKKIVSKTSIL